MPDLYFRYNVLLEAEQATETGELENVPGFVSIVEVGDWVLTRQDGSQSVMCDARFQDESKFVLKGGFNAVA